MRISTRFGVSYPSADRTDAPDVPAHLSNIVDGLEKAALYGQGPIASRPVSTPGTPGIQGRLYASTDETPQRVYYDYGTGWFQIGALAAGAIGTTELADNSVTAAKIATGAVGTDEIADGSITNPDYQDNSISLAKLASALKPSQGAGAAAEALRALGTAAGLAAAGTHAAQHAPTGADPVDFAAAGVAPIGAVADYAGSTDPSAYWLICDGRALARTGTYAALFAAIGTAYGAGDGSTTFNIPDCRGRVTVGVDGTAARLVGPDTLGASSGEEKHQLTISELASHTHGVTDPGHQHSPPSGSTSFIAAGISNVGTGTGYNWGNGAFTLAAFTGITINSNGSDTPHNNMQPYVVTNKIIRVR